jgi:hypothetical protein
MMLKVFKLQRLTLLCGLICDHCLSTNKEAVKCTIDQANERLLLHFK